MYGAQTIGQAGNAAASADLAPDAAHEHDVHAAAPQVAGLVEAVLGRAGPLDLDDGLDHGALRRRPAARKLEQHGLAERRPIEPPDLRGNADLEPRAPGRAGHDAAHAGGLADLRGEHAAVERVETHASPPQPGEQQERARGTRSAPARARRRGGRDREHGHERDQRSPTRTRFASGEAARRASRRAGAGEQRSERAHGAATSRSCSRRAGPIPGTASSSSTEVNAPCSSRKSRIFCAVDGPTPGSASSCSSVAVFRCSRSGGQQSPALHRAAGAGARRGHDAPGRRPRPAPRG